MSLKLNCAVCISVLISVRKVFTSYDFGFVTIKFLTETLNHLFQRNQRDSRSQNHHDEPWFDRFMKLANAIYNRDSRSTGMC